MAIGFGIIGCGMIAHFHARAIGDVRGAKLVACCDKGVGDRSCTTSSFAFRKRAAVASSIQSVR